ncbi:MAG: DoxX family protein [Bacteroidetes bacterium]|nr:DoxX family protein [Bacteroidota bacterium]
MNLLHSVERWGDAHHPKWLDIIRVVLGLFLVFKGIDFINHMDRLTDLMGRSRFLGSLSLGLLAHYIVFAHLVGAALITAGLLTRLACLVQIPILIGAVFFINSSAGILAPYDVLWLSVIVLLLLVFFLIAGSGPFSVDEQMKK